MADVEPHVDEHLTGLHDQHRRVTGFFPGQRAHEKVHLCFRQHWLASVSIVTRFALLGLIIPMLAFSVVSFIGVATQLPQWSMLVFTVYLMFVWLLFFIDFLKIKLSVMLITSERLIDIAQTSLFNHQVSEANIDRIQDVLGFRSGMLGTFLDVGKLEIQTAGTEPFMFYMVKAPHLSARKILNVQRQCLQSRRQSDGGGNRSTDTMHKRADDTLTDEEIMRLRSTDPSSKRETPNV